MRLPAPDAVGIIERGLRHAVVYKPGGVPCHRSTYVGATAGPPLLQTARDLLGRRVFLAHRLDQGSSGCVLVGLEGDDGSNEAGDLSASLAAGRKTYFAFCRGSGELLRALGDGSATEYATPSGEVWPVGRLDADGCWGERQVALPHETDGWFVVERPIKNENGNERDATTALRLIVGSTDPRCCLVAARPLTGRWHQIRRHLNGVSHPILGDTRHGNTRTNREWHGRGLPSGRLALHLHRLELPQVSTLIPAMDVTAPLPAALAECIATHLPAACHHPSVGDLFDAQPWRQLEEEG